MVNAENFASLKEAIGEKRVTGTFLPSVYIVEPTNRCNVKCIMCPNHKFAPDQLGDMECGRFAKIVAEIAPFAELTMLYFLGESTLHPSFPRLLQIARETLSGRIVVSTNAFKLSSPVIEALVTNTDIIIACIDRWDRRAYEDVRRGSNFDSVIRTTELLLSSRRGQEVPTIIVKGLDIALSRDGNDREDEKAAFRAFWSARGAVPLVGWLDTWAGQMPQLRKHTAGDSPYLENARVSCADLWFKMAVNWRGEVVLCCHDWKSSQVLGVLGHDSLRNVWHSTPLIELRRKHLDGMYSENALCDTCREWGEAKELGAYVRLDANDIYRVF